MKHSVKKYVETHLLHELKIVQNSHRQSLLTELNIYEKSVIYKYTSDGYEDLNSRLREGLGINEFGKHLTQALEKLPDYTLLCYRATKVSGDSIEKYISAMKKETIITEKSFLSCSKSKYIALAFSSSPLFVILSKRGKDIEKIAKFGIESGQNEKEILFKPNSKFRVLNIKEEHKRVTITLEEV